MCSCPVRAGKALEGHGRPLRITLSRASDCTKHEIMLDVALHFDPGGHSCAEKLNKTNDRVGRETRQLFKLGQNAVFKLSLAEPIRASSMAAGTAHPTGEAASVRLSGGAPPSPGQGA